MTAIDDAIFGLPRSMTRRDADAVVSALTDAWLAQTGGGYPLALADDLRTLERFFDPLAREATLRNRLEELPRIDPTPSLSPPLALEVGDGRVLVTPEGRIALELLRDASDRGGEVVIDDVAAVRATAQLVDFYRGINRRRLEKVVKLAAGEESPMLPVAVAFVLLLLVNRSTSASRAIDQSSDDPDRRALIDAWVAPPLQAFAHTLSGEGLNARDGTSRGLSLYQGYAVTEARRRLGSRLRTTSDLIWIPEECEDDVLTFIARDVRRRATAPTALGAFDALVESYRRGAHRAANLEMAHERPAHTARLRERFRQLLG